MSQPEPSVLSFLWLCLAPWVSISIFLSLYLDLALHSFLPLLPYCTYPREDRILTANSAEVDRKSHKCSQLK